MTLMVKRLLCALTAFSVLFAAVTHAPGVMLSAQNETLTFEICTGTEIKTITVTVPVEEREPHRDYPGCDFFTSQIAVLLADQSSLTLQLTAKNFEHRLPFRDIAVKRLAQNSHLTRGPPVLS